VAPLTPSTRRARLFPARTLSMRTIEGVADADDFDNWCVRRSPRRPRRCSPLRSTMSSATKIGRQRGWRPVPDYGTVWFSTCDHRRWAPLSLRPLGLHLSLGWTWVDDASWGFAPFLMAVGFLWQAPGLGTRAAACRRYLLMSARFYAPLLSLGSVGPHFGVGVWRWYRVGGFAAGVNVGWFPLGRVKSSCPSYAVSRAYVNRVNISNTTMNETVVNNYYNTTVVNRTQRQQQREICEPGRSGCRHCQHRHARSPLPARFRAISLPLTKEVASAPVGFSCSSPRAPPSRP